VHEAKTCLEQRSYVILDVRPAKAFDQERLVKPPKSCFNAPASLAPDAFAAAVAKGLGRALTRGVLVMGTAGEEDAAAPLQALLQLGFVNAQGVSGGWTEWRKHYTTTCRPTPPVGRWVPTGQEALKSGLMSGDAAFSYEEKLNVDEVTRSK